MTEGLTVIVPNYNKSEYIERCVKSIEDQIYKPDAVIIVDDASTDNSRAVIDSLIKRYPNVRAYYKPENSGVSNTRNVGISLADTEYITFIDADDYYCNDDKLKLEMALQKEKGGDIIAYSVVKFIASDGSSSTIKKKRSYYLQGNVRSDILITRKWDSIMRDYIVRTATLKECGGYNEAHSLYEDYELLLVLARDHEFYCTGEFGTAYTEGQGLSSADKKEQARIQDEIVRAELSRDTVSYRMQIMLKRKFRLLRRKIRNLI
ncbi:MAG: glycosyltransferase family 2 protein [Lachnospiraceae bacterium]|nr:glycosyltransferase family 2 protein [Lachnospiraceae bacterium]